MYCNPNRYEWRGSKRNGGIDLFDPFGKLSYMRYLATCYAHNYGADPPSKAKFFAG